ncbi:MAG: AtpZ/AtpI family protein [Saprospiraceae bacterium]
MPKPPPDPANEERRKDIRDSGNAYLKYSGIAIQMTVILLLFVFAGRYLDSSSGDGTGRTWTVVLSLVGVFAGLYVALRDFIHPPK